MEKKEFNTGYSYIDERADNVRKMLPEDLKEELNYVLVKVHSLGVDKGYSAGLRSKHLYEETVTK